MPEVRDELARARRRPRRRHDDGAAGPHEPAVGRRRPHADPGLAAEAPREKPADEPADAGPVVAAAVPPVPPSTITPQPAAAAAPATPPPRTATPPPPVEETEPRRRRRAPVLWLVAGLVAVLLAGLITFLVIQGGSGSPTATGSGTTRRDDARDLVGSDHRRVVVRGVELEPGGDQVVVLEPRQHPRPRGARSRRPTSATS